MQFGGAIVIRSMTNTGPAHGHGSKAVIFFSAAFLLVTSVSLLRATVSQSDDCYRAAWFAAHETNVPVNVLLAIASTETGRKVEGKTQPWPWAINVAGKGSWLATEAELLEKALSLIASGERRFDVGCFQLNYHWHNEGFASLDEMISPRTNALYAARFLKSLHAEFGNWVAAAGAYHSRTEALANIYKAKFLQHYDDNDAPIMDHARQTSVTSKPRMNTYPLLHATSGTAHLGSLVPSASR